MLKVLNGAWWIVIYELFITVGHIGVFTCGTIPQYRIAAGISHFINSINERERVNILKRYNHTDGNLFSIKHPIINYSN
jgi:hypothetical protein